MLKEANHLDTVKRMRVSEADLTPLLPNYEASSSRTPVLYFTLISFPAERAREAQRSIFTVEPSPGVSASHHKFEDRIAAYSVIDAYR